MRKMKNGHARGCVIEAALGIANEKNERLDMPAAASIGAVLGIANEKNEE